MYSIEESDATRREYHLRLIEIKKKNWTLECTNETSATVRSRYKLICDVQRTLCMAKMANNDGIIGHEYEREWTKRLIHKNKMSIAMEKKKKNVKITRLWLLSTYSQIEPV